MQQKPRSIDEILASVKPEQRVALEKLRQTIHAAAPKAEECISYGLAAFRLDGRPLVAFGAGTEHCAFYPMSGSIVAALKDDLKGYETSKGTIRFSANKPLPAALVRKVIKARIAENEARPSGTKSAQTDPAAAQFVSDLKHPLKKEVAAVRKVILGASTEIREGIKWNSPSFRTTEFFATLNLRAGRVWLILHLGAKVKDNSKKLTVADPTGILKWLAKDRALVTFESAKDVRAKQKALVAILRQWIRHV